MASSQDHRPVPPDTPSRNKRKITDPKTDDVVAKFKSKVDEVSEGYLAFFNERVRIEETYIDSLQRLYVRSRAFDAQFTDDLDGAMPTARLAWREVRDHTSREADSRRAFVGALRESVVKDLHDVKETQGRIRGRIKADLKMAEDMYNDQAEYKLPRLKKAYLKKCQEVEDQKRQDTAIALQAKLLADPIKPSQNISPLSDEYSAQAALPTLGAGLGTGQGPPIVTPPAAPSSNPAMTGNPIDILPSSQHLATLSAGDIRDPGRKRSGSNAAQAQAQAKEVFNDIATQSKKQLNAFISRLGGDKDKDRSEKQDETSAINAGQSFSHGHSRSISEKPVAARDVHMPPGGGLSGQGKPPSALKGVKLRREMEEADKAYRSAVFNLETLRLRREKIHTAAKGSLEQFNIELTETLRETLTSYVDCLAATSATNVQLSEHARQAVESIDVEKDLSLHRARNPRREAAHPAPVLYENFYVGPCRSLIFGVSLNDYDFQRGEGGDHGSPPMILQKCIGAVEQRGLDTEGIYRVSGRQASLQSLVHAIEQDEVAFQFREKDEVFAIAGILKQYCRQLPEPIFHFPLVERIRHTENRESHISSNFSVLRAKLSRLPVIHQSTFRAIIEHLARVAAHSSRNKMDARNLAVVFGTALFGEDELPKDGDLANFPTGKDTVAADMIEYAPLLFGQSEIPGPVLPAGMALTRSGSLQYKAENARAGSSHTRAKLPAPVENPPVETEDTPTALPSLGALTAAEGPNREAESQGQSDSTDTLAEKANDGTYTEEHEATAESQSTPEQTAL